MKITAIKLQVKDPERVSVFVDDKYSFSLSYNEVITSQIKNNMEVSPADVKKFKKISDDGKLRARSLEWLLNRPHSIREFKDYLYRKKADPELSHSLVQEFSDKRYLDEKKFGEWLIDLLRRRGKSNRAIQAELFKKGLGREMIDELMGIGDNNEEQRLKGLIAKKRRSSRYKNDPKKLAQYLSAQGFNWQDVKQALRVDTGEE